MVVVVFLKKNKEGFEQPIAFFRKSLQHREHKYDINKRHVYALIKLVKSFRCYLVGAIVIDFDPSATVKDIFSQHEVFSRRCKWIIRIQEFNMDVQITKLVRIQGLENMMAQSNLDANQINLVDVDHQPNTCDKDYYEWYTNVIYYL